MTDERLRDLVRFARVHLHLHELITDEEYAELLNDSGPARVGRLRTYDQMQAEIDRLRAENAELKEAAAGAWRDFDEDCYPEDETDVLWLEKFNNGRGLEYRVSVGRMSRRCGCYGPSHAVAFAEINLPEESKP